MIEYKFGDILCKLSFRDFLSITTKNGKNLKKDFKTFYNLYEFIEIYKKDITHILFDGYEYFLEKGILHNLYGPAYIRYDEDGYFPGTHRIFYIDGKLVYDEGNKKCTKLEDFNKEIYHFEEITGKQSGHDPITGIRYRRREDIDYKMYPINLKHRILIDQRKKKLQKLNDSNDL